MSNPYQVPKHTVQAEVLLTTGPALQLRFFLSEAAMTHEGPERPSDLLRRAKSFLPVNDTGGEGVSILRREAIMVLTISETDEIEPGDPDGSVLAGGAGGRIEVLLVTGTKVEGELRYQMPEGQRRIQDFLNTGEPFLMLRSEGKISFVNKSHVVRIRALD